MRVSDRAGPCRRRHVSCDCQRVVHRVVFRTHRPATIYRKLEVFSKLALLTRPRAEAIYQTERTLRDATVVLRGARSFVALRMRAADRLVGPFTMHRQQVRQFNQATTRWHRFLPSEHDRTRVCAHAGLDQGKPLPCALQVSRLTDWHLDLGGIR